MNQEISKFEMSVLKIICKYYSVELEIIKTIYKKVNLSFDKTIEVIVLSSVFNLDVLVLADKINANEYF